ncbi:hypothetical protein ACJMK2_017200, partial [Sinanodonta woodiana]
MQASNYKHSIIERKWVCLIHLAHMVWLSVRDWDVAVIKNNICTCTDWTGWSCWVTKSATPTGKCQHHAQKQSFFLLLLKHNLMRLYIFAINQYLPQILTKFVLVGVHIKPEDAVAEIGHMYNVYLDILGHWPGVKNVLVMGDLNADCSYASENDLRPLTIYIDPRFDWLLGWEADTTVSTNTDCAYDRFIAAGTELRSAIVPGTSAVYRYEKDFVLDYDT